MSDAPVWTFLFAGFANRLFQVASALGAARRLGRPFKIIGFHDNYEHGSVNYEEFFERSAPGEKIARLPNRNVIEYVDKIGMHVVSDQSHTFMDPVDIEALKLKAAETPILFNGYFQNETNFKDIRGELLQLFRAPDHIAEVLAGLGNELEKVVAIHVRLGDAKFNPMLNHSLYGYYQRAIALASEKVPGARFIVITDEPGILGRVYPILEGYDIIDHPDDLFGFYLMTQCAGVICANSTFSWWAAWLNDRAGKFVSVPKPWANTLPGRTLQMAGAFEVDA